MPEQIEGSQYEYSDVLRAVGNYLDSHGFRDITIAVVENGMLLTGQVVTPSERNTQLSMEAYLFTAADLDASLASAYARRGVVATLRVGERLPYEDVLRVIGAYADTEGWRHIGVFETLGTIHAKGYIDSRLVSRSFTEQELRALVANVAMRRPSAARQNQPRRSSRTA